jgi:hypothetical protein
MTPLAGLIAALVSAFILRDARRSALALLPSWIAVLIFQTSMLAAGKGVSPPSTVSQASYWVVQVIILAMTFGIATQLGSILSTRTRVALSGDALRRGYVRAIGLSTAASAVLIYVGFGLARSVFDPGSVTHHSAEGKPPIAGVVGILGMVIGCVVLAAMRWQRRRSSSRSVTVTA